MYAAKGDHAGFGGFQPALEAAETIRSQLDRIQEVRVHVLTDARVRDRAVDEINVFGRPVATEVWDIERRRWSLLWTRCLTPLALMSFRKADQAIAVWVTLSKAAASAMTRKRSAFRPRACSFNDACTISHRSCVRACT
ncbi:hypothetical protein ACCS99_20045 [Rhizobium ruizarguesonis]